ncbi:hypothetical protein OC846_003075 [Tilletia horrida]|uniref:Uncharacterized protein n=1 Tax=Tilletia horrida TaxID=155126 RepID=A0AAN6JUA0_9BASI|nr:hypothetical protein OC845_002810 [Tilletia horrida]KAK0551991.1 hypothetical protein OC846_003075 [Tilletia horrida]
MDLFRHARDRAQEVVQQAQSQLQQQQQKHSSSSSTAAPGSSSSSQQLVSSGTRPSSNTSSLPSLSALYTGSLPPLIRAGIANLDPRFESTRQSHLLSNALKALSIDHEATARETKSVATATFKFGQDLSPTPVASSASAASASSRLDGSCDPALVDITDRLAYVLSTIGDLEAAHVKRAESARKEFKDISRAEVELNSRREKRIKIHKELLALVPERAKPASAKRIGDLEAQLKSLEAEDKASEEVFGKLRRQKFQSSYSKYMDSLIELGEKLACAARHGKTLTSLIPVDETPVFPAAALAGAHSWNGTAQTAQVRAAIDPALRNLQIDYAPASLTNVAVSGSTTGSIESGPNSATAGYAESHATEIAEADRTQAAVVNELSSTAPHATAESRTDSLQIPPPPLNRIDSGSSYGVSPSGGASSPIAARLNMGPTPHLPMSPPLPSGGAAAVGSSDASAGIAPGSTGGDGGASAAPGIASDERSPHAPPEDVTVAETGAAIFGTGGPKTGTLGVPRRRSSAVPSGSASSPSPAATGAPSSAAAAKSAEAAAERAAAEQAEVVAAAERERAMNRASLSGHAGAIPAAAPVPASVAPAVHARLRRDGTIVRRGEPDWAAAETEDLPPYTVEDTSGGRSAGGA